MNMQPPLQRTANQLSDYGRFGDSTLVHMNPAEVRGLASMSPTGELSINPVTGQPEAFLPFLAPIIGSALGTSLLGGTALGMAGAGALGAGLATWSESGDFEKGLISGVTGFGLGKLFGAGADAAHLSDELAGLQGAQQAVTETGTALAGQPIPQMLAGPPSPTTPQAVLDMGGQHTFLGAEPLTNISEGLSPEQLAFVDAKSGFGNAQNALEAGRAALTPGQRAGAMFSGEGLKGMVGALKDPAAVIPLGLGAATQANVAQQEYMEDLRKKQLGEQTAKNRRFESILHGAREMASRTRGTNPYKNPFAAEGGRVGYQEGGHVGQEGSWPYPSWDYVPYETADGTLVDATGGILEGDTDMLTAGGPPGMVILGTDQSAVNPLITTGQIAGYTPDSGQGTGTYRDDPWADPQEGILETGVDDEGNYFIKTLAGSGAEQQSFLRGDFEQQPPPDYRHGFEKEFDFFEHEEEPKLDRGYDLFGAGASDYLAGMYGLNEEQLASFYDQIQGLSPEDRTLASFDDILSQFSGVTGGISNVDAGIEETTAGDTVITAGDPEDITDIISGADPDIVDDTLTSTAGVNLLTQLQSISPNVDGDYTQEEADAIVSLIAGGADRQQIADYYGMTLAELMDYYNALTGTGTTTDTVVGGGGQDTVVGGGGDFVPTTSYYKYQGPDGQWLYKAVEGMGRTQWDIGITKEEYDAAMAGGTDVVDDDTVVADDVEHLYDAAGTRHDVQPGWTNSTVASYLADGTLTAEEAAGIAGLLEASSDEGDAAIMGTFGAFDDSFATQFQDYLDSLGGDGADPLAAFGTDAATATEDELTSLISMINSGETTVDAIAARFGVPVAQIQGYLDSQIYDAAGNRYTDPGWTNSTVGSYLADGTLTDEELADIAHLLDVSSDEGKGAILGTFGDFDDALRTQFDEYLDTLDATTVVDDTTIVDAAPTLLQNLQAISPNVDGDYSQEEANAIVSLIDGGADTQQIADYYGMTVDELMGYYNTITGSGSVSATGLLAQLQGISPDVDGDYSWDEAKAVAGLIESGADRQQIADYYGMTVAELDDYYSAHVQKVHTPYINPDTGKYWTEEELMDAVRAGTLTLSAANEQYAAGSMDGAPLPFSDEERVSLGYTDPYYKYSEGQGYNMWNPVTGMWVDAAVAGGTDVVDDGPVEYDEYTNPATGSRWTTRELMDAVLNGSMTLREASRHPSLAADEQLPWTDEERSLIPAQAWTFEDFEWDTMQDLRAGITAGTITPMEAYRLSGRYEFVSDPTSFTGGVSGDGTTVVADTATDTVVDTVEDTAAAATTDRSALIQDYVKQTFGDPPYTQDQALDFARVALDNNVSAEEVADALNVPLDVVTDLYGQVFASSDIATIPEVSEGEIQDVIGATTDFSGIPSAELWAGSGAYSGDMAGAEEAASATVEYQNQQEMEESIRNYVADTYGDPPYTQQQAMDFAGVALEAGLPAETVAAALGVPVDTVKALYDAQGAASGGQVGKRQFMTSVGPVELANGGIADLPVSPEMMQPMEEVIQEEVIVEEEPYVDFPQLIEMTVEAIKGNIEEPDAIINQFIEEYGVEKFQMLRDAVLKSVAGNPEAQTEGIISGAGGGMDDEIMGVIGEQQDIAVSPGEYIVAADVLSGLGDGDTNAGADVMDQVAANVRAARTGGRQPAPIDLSKVMPA